ncbi:MAG: glycerophosphodiester phosphodiesterase family protein [bacterium]|nr:glycerophosphodiester phosphodiesterase family protein [bacterium]
MFMNIAHRGFSSQYPENTRLAFQKALDLGITWMEYDLQITRDNHLVVMHDKTVDRTTNGQGLVANLTLKEIQDLDAGAHAGREFAGEPVPTFEETLDLLHGKARMAVELKFEGNDPIDQVLDILQNRNLLDQVSITSFDLAKLPVVKTRCPEVSTTALIKQETRPNHNWIGEALTLGVDTLGPRCNETTRTLVDRAHTAGLVVRCWGLGKDQGPEMERLLDLQVDGMTTDCPDILQEILARRTPG